jgi:hypothetical protein
MVMMVMAPGSALSMDRTLLQTLIHPTQSGVLAAIQTPSAARFLESSAHHTSHFRFYVLIFFQDFQEATSLCEVLPEPPAR